MSTNEQPRHGRTLWDYLAEADGDTLIWVVALCAMVLIAAIEAFSKHPAG